MTDKAKEIKKFMDKRYPKLKNAIDDIHFWTLMIQCIEEFASLNQEEGLVKKEDVIGRLKSMRPNVQEPTEWDKSKEKDWFYCVEWGRKKGQYQEGLVLERYIKELAEPLPNPPKQ